MFMVYGSLTEVLKMISNFAEPKPSEITMSLDDSKSFL